MKSQALVCFPFTDLTPSMQTLGESVFPKTLSMHPERARGYLTARFALLEAYQQLGIKLEFSDLQNLKDNRHQDFQDFFFSLSHTSYRGKTVAGALLQKKNFAVGLDLEWKSRSIQKGAEHFFVREEDYEIDPLVLWCLKEAAFKSISSVFPPGLVLKELWVRGSNFGHYKDPTKNLGQVKYQVNNFLGSELLVATAFREI
ncbi:MAG: 4'-phosphopantetheinyl transferase family protein [Bacteriovoracaceae bacterium]